jgi:hypothetical protein
MGGAEAWSHESGGRRAALAPPRRPRSLIASFKAVELAAIRRRRRPMVLEPRRFFMIAFPLFEYLLFVETIADVRGTAPNLMRDVDPHLVLAGRSCWRRDDGQLQVDLERLAQANIEADSRYYGACFWQAGPLPLYIPATGENRVDACAALGVTIRAQVTCVVVVRESLTLLAMRPSSWTWKSAAWLALSTWAASSHVMCREGSRSHRTGARFSGISGGHLMMSRARSHVRTALFVDFDNMYLNLKAIDPAAGEAFATEPDRWLRWMREDMGQVVPDATEETSREILIRACYLNPVSFGKFRPYFTRSAFRVVDCPSLTSRGKNSADIYMVLDIVDTLAHSTYFDEFVLLSADADFTPVMLRLRAHDRRTVLLASGPSATALQSACDMVVPLDVFLNEALGISLHQASPQARPVSSLPGAPAPQLPGQVGSNRLQQAMRDELQSVMAAAEAPVPMAAAADRVRAPRGVEVMTSCWGGSGSFRKFVESMTGDGLQVSGPHPPGYLRDPRRHDPIEAQEPRVPLPDSVAGLAHQVARIVGVPQLTPEAYRILFEEIACLSADNSLSEPLNAIEPTIRDACAVRGARVTRAAIHFVLQGLQAAGVDWRTPSWDVSTLAREFADNVVRLCLNARMELTPEEVDELRSWISGGGPSPTIPSAAESVTGSANQRSV